MESRHRRKQSMAVQLLALLLFLCGCLPLRAQLVEVGDGGPGPVKAQHLTAEMTALRPQIAAGGSLTAGLVLTLEEHWHVYWINAGDSAGAMAVITASSAQIAPPWLATSNAPPSAGRFSIPCTSVRNHRS